MSRDRTITYDGLDRLKTTVPPMWGAGTASYSYDALDTLTRVMVPATEYAASRNHPLLLRRFQLPDLRQDRKLHWPDGHWPGLRRARQPGQQERAGLPVHPGQPPGRGGGPGGLPLRRAGPPGAGVVAHAGQHPVAVRPRRAPGLPAGPAPQRAGGAGVPWARAGWPGASR